MGERERHQIWAFKNGHSNYQIGPQGAEKQLRKVYVGGCVGGWYGGWWVVCNINI